MKNDFSANNSPSTPLWIGAPTLATSLSDRNNALNLVRLVLASAVVLGHAWPLTGSKAAPSLEFLSGIAVNGFFAASGYLIAASRVRVSFPVYLWRRALRIFPGFIVCLLVIAFFFAPLASLLQGTPNHWASNFSFVYRNALLYIQQWGIDGTLGTVPYAGAWNGSLWTIFFEFVAYIVLGVLLTGSWAKRARIVVPLVFVSVVIFRVAAVGPLDISTNLYLNGLRLAGYFLAGAVFYFFADRITLRPWYTGAAIAAYVGLWQIDATDFFGQIPLTYIVLSIGALRWTGVAPKSDISYGVYIYAFPVQQTLVLLGSAPWGAVLNSALTLVITAVFAWLSWVYIERPALGLKDFQPFKDLRPNRSRQRDKNETAW